MPVGQTELLNRQFRLRATALAIFASLATIFFLYPTVSSIAVEPLLSQQRRRPRPRPATPDQTQPRGRNYSRFQHVDHRPPVAKLDCDSCHAIPSAAAPDTIVAATKPKADGYPYHDSCVRCHRPQFFKGATPPICTVCHTRATPRVTARDMHKFPKETSKTIAREFPGYFPHSLHQRVIARRENPAGGLFGGWSFVRASFETPQEASARALDNCASCHLTDARPSPEITVGGTEGKITPAAKTFKTVPEGHATCFNCHWEAQKPTKDDCAGCHLAQGEYAKKKRAASVQVTLPGVLSANAVKWFENWPATWPKRLSLKFNHETPPAHDIGCTTCHINITQMETLNIPKADVPIATCMPCHYSTSPVSRKGGELVTIYSEMTKEAKDTDNKTNTCVGCHVTVIGSERPPCSHYLVLAQPCPK